ncbi:hypothetical protein CNMCM6936_001266 [Aspergillus lentulus]|nr:hypothetical protein CNMCM6936_001266 [Aspergillus lentulus]
MSSSQTDPIAIVGMACRFPGGSNTPSKLWNLLKTPYDVLQEFPPSRLNLNRFYHAQGTNHGSTNVTNRSYLLDEDVKAFDAKFFSISSPEAESMDPQQRILLETVYEAMESAGWTLEDVHGSQTSVHVGAMNADYTDIQNRDTETMSKYNATGTVRSILSNRVSYVFDLHGPSVTIDTACSSSLVALHQAMHSLRSGDCDSAIVGGVNLILDPAMFIAESKLSMLSAESRSRMWDQAANGYARGEGIAALILKPLSQALQHGDPIQAIVRATGVNSDGRSSGITMPTAAAQTALIRQTYKQAGLDPLIDRPQFFECHGTGTQAGDPIEARAIRDAFFPTETSDEVAPLFVGSVKTVIGHTEGCAGLAGVLKAVLAIRNQTIPPNLLFNQLSDSVRPFYGRLQIPTTSLPWPDTISGSPKRASVNSFGFGGTNAHALIEEYKPQVAQSGYHADQALGPLVISAHSGPALLNKARDLLSYMISNPSANLPDICWTLQTRRTTHKVRCYFSNRSYQSLLDSLAAFVQTNQNLQPEQIGFQPQLIDRNESPGVLGVFTGQGAQWPTMGMELFSRVALFRQSIEQCEAVLNALPDRPAWSLCEELKAGNASSRLSEAAVSQPLCTAVQIALVDVLKAAGLKFHAVVGHSSGEIAAVYAAGMLSLTGAMQIAYYRGLHAHLAKGDDGQPGGMLATGLSYDEALQFCNHPDFRGRICVAASNSPTSVTISGDLDAISIAKKELEARDVFARPLRVDTAYHSHHMKKCSDTYLQSLLACDIAVGAPIEDCVWSSSVRGDTEILEGDLSPLKGDYWVKNMEQTVLFSQALESAITNGGPFDMAVEVGPHPALKSPSEDTLKAVFGSAPHYTGVLKRGEDDLVAISSALGLYWSTMGSKSVDFAGFRRACLGGSEIGQPEVITDLPCYPWDHTQTFWRESRLSQRYRLGQDSPCGLLGRRMPDDDAHELRWRNILTLDENTWLAGHEILGEVLMPGAGYVSIALEAGRQLAAGRPISLLEARDVEVRHPVAVPKHPDSVETMYIARVQPSQDRNIIEAEFDFCYWPSSGTAAVRACSGRIVVYLGDGKEESLPPRRASPTNLLNVSVADAYDVFKSIGLNYQGIFRGMSSIDRGSNHAVTQAVWDTSNLDQVYLVHPAILDVVFQSIFLAKSYPAKSLMHSAFLPVRIARVTVNPCVPVTNTTGSIEIGTESFVTHSDYRSIEGDMHVYNRANKPFLEVEGLSLKIAGELQESDDVQIFCQTTWGPDISLDLPEPERNDDHDSEQSAIATTIDRICFFYLRNCLDQLNAVTREHCQLHHQRMIKSFERILDLVRRGQHALIDKEWLEDDFEVVQSLLQKYPDQIDLELVVAIGNTLPKVVKGETQLLEVMLENNMLGRYYVEGCGFVTINREIERLLQKITFKFPRAKILEVGAGTGGTTQGILEAIGSAYDSYTFTDISTGFFEKANERLQASDKPIIFKALDIEKPVVDQGFTEAGYDVIIAVNVLHATRDLKNTLNHVRSLLKPGGYLILGEITNTDVLRHPFIMGGLPGWWLGDDEGRRFHPCVSALEWDQLLLDTGFSGLDLTFEDLEDSGRHCNSLLVSRALDHTFEQIREPLTALKQLDADSRLLLIGGATLPIAKARTEIQKLLPPSWRARTQVVSSIDAIEGCHLTPGMGVICLQELDSPLFSKTMDEHRWKNLQLVMANASRVLWVVKNHRSASPESAMFMGIARALSQELPHLTLQVLDLESKESPATTARTALESFVRLTLTSNPSAHNDNAFLWFNEPEIVSVDGQLLVPRILPIKSMDDRYNASRRELKRPAMLADQVVEIKPSTSGLALVEVQEPGLYSENDLVKVRVKYSMRINESAAPNYYLSAGTIESSGEPVMCLSLLNRSHLQVSRSQLHFVDDDQTITTKAILVLVKKFLMALALASVVQSHQTAMVHNADDLLARAISQTIEGRLHFSASNAVVRQDRIVIHPRSSARIVRLDLPVDIAVLLDCSEQSQSNEVLVQCVPATCRIYGLDSSLIRNAIDQLGTAPLLTKANGLVSEFIRQNDISELQGLNPDVQGIANISKSNVKSLGLVDWEATAPVALTVQPIEPRHLLRPDRTYLMIGMTGAMGLSLCQWAVQNGARSIVLTSRNPSVDEDWLIEARSLGADVQVWPMNIASRAAVGSVISRINSTMPQLAGVCNGAMVLNDKLFLDMDAQGMNAVLEPKFRGSQILDEVLGDQDLDFFILLSSCAMLIGNPGQANYHAANLYMASLAANRRTRGLAASIVHLGYIADVGYITRQDQSMRERLEKLLFRPLCESDIHNAFAEAIRASRPNGRDDPFDFAMGMGPSREYVPPNKQPYYFANPRFAHFNPPAVEVQDGVGQKTTVKNVIHLVQEATSKEEASLAVQVAFSNKLESIMQLPPGTVDPKSSLMDAGIDSLVAVEIRNWFKIELGVQIPVVKILGGISIEELCVEAANKMLAVILANKQSTPTNDEGQTSESAVVVDEHDDSISTDSKSGVDDTEQDGSIGSSRDNLDVLTPATGSDIDNLSVADEDLASLRVAKDAGDLPPPEIIREGPISSAQSRVWFLSANSGHPTNCNLTFVYNVTGHLQIHRLRHALNVVMTAHDTLHSCFYMRPGDNQLVQGVMSEPRHLFVQLEKGNATDALREFNKLKAKKWNLEKGQMLGMTVIPRGQQEHTIILGYHHIIMDAFSLSIFFRDLHTAYRTGTLQRRSIDYMDLVAQERLLSEDKSEDLDTTAKLQFWKNEFTEPVDILPLMPMARLAKRPASLGPFTSYKSTRVEQTQWSAIVKTCRELGLTPFHFTLATFQVLLARYANIEDICIGVADANRLNERYTDIIGFFMNILPIRSKLSKSTKFADLARTASKKVLTGLVNSGVSLDTILELSNAPRSPSYTPLFQAAINYRMGAISDISLGDCELTMVDGQDAENPFDISLGVLESKNGSALIEVICNSDLYDSDGCGILLDSFLRLLHDFAAHPEKLANDGQLHDPAAWQKALILGRGPRIDYSATWPATLSERFVTIARSHGESLAITCGGNEITYNELQAQVLSIAQTLLEAGCGDGSCVGVLCEPSPDFIAAMLAILHIGGIYCPLDVSLPHERHRAILQSSRFIALIHHSATSDRALALISSMASEDHQMNVIALDGEAQRQASDVPIQPPTDSASVLLFTSGSTGKPKGIFLTQSNFINHISLKTQVLGLQSETILQQSSMGFDMSIIQILSALLNGGRVLIVPSESRRDPVEIARLVSQGAVTLTIATPSEYKMWLRYGSDEHLRNKATAWRHACLGGEPVTEQLCRDFALLDLPHLGLTNCYGPTEITAAATFQSIHISMTGEKDHRSMMNVGKALPNYSVHIVDSKGHFLPIGMQGEICIGGAGVALGYCGLPEQTAAKFIVDPTTSTEWPFKRLYRTGDQGRLLEDGSLLFMGRLDGNTQIKLNGVRIELEEVEGAILAGSDGKLSTVVAVAHKDRLLAYATLTAGISLTETETKQLLIYASLPLPTTMQPSKLIIMDTLPLTSAGKIDREAIQHLATSGQPNGPISSNGTINKLTLRQGHLRLLWEKVLGGPDRSIGPESDFFHVGGNSMALMRLQGAIRESMDVAVSTRDLHQASTLAEMTARIQVQQEQGQVDQPQDEISWDTETEIPALVRDALRQVSTRRNDVKSPKKHEIEILLTGATSFLGGAILRALAELTGSRIRKVHCIAVLHDDKKLIPASQSVAYYNGSLMSRRLGLTVPEYEHLQSNVDLIIHAGSNGHCLNNFHSLRTANLNSTHELIAMALPRSTPLLYLSSNRVTLLSGSTAYPPVSISHSPPPKDGSEGYMASKWASEVFLENLKADKSCPQLPIQISRPCVVVGAEAPNSDALNAILRYSRLMQTVPVFDRVEGYFDFKDVQEVAQEVVSDALALLDVSTDSSAIRFRHHSGGVRTSLGEFRQRMEQIYEVPFDECSLQDWIDRALQAGIDPLITAYLEGMVERGEVLRFPFMGEEVSQGEVSTGNGNEA